MNAKVAEALNQVALPVVPYDTCKRMDYWWFQVKTSMICCGYTLPDELKSVCQVKQVLQEGRTGCQRDDFTHLTSDVVSMFDREIQVVLWCARMLPGVPGKFTV